MARGSISRRTTDVTSDHSNWELRTPAGAIARIEEISLVQVTGTASSFGLGRPAARGVTPTSPVAFNSDSNAGEVLLTTTSLAWGTSPTAPTSYVRKWNSAATVGVGVIWSFPSGELVIPNTSSLVIHNITASVALDVNCLISERANT